jgi:hypothetical protein
MKTELPVWEERELPTTYVVDVRAIDKDYSILPRSDLGENRDFLLWMNSFKKPLHDELRQISHLTEARLERRGIDLGEINDVVAEVTDRKAYPLTRLVTAHDAAKGYAYNRAAAMGFFPVEMQFKDNSPAYGQFIYLMNFIRFRADYLNKAPKVDVIDTVAHALGYAVLQRTTSVVIPEGPDPAKLRPYSYAGYSWRYNDHEYGEPMDTASAAKIAAKTRKEMGIRTAGQPAPNPIVEAYRENRGFSYAAMGAIALDVINQAAGLSDELAIYRPIWDFMQAGNEEAARGELRDIFKRATDGSIQLEEFEAARMTINGIPKAMLMRIEEVCGVDASMRPSRSIKVSQIY